MVRILPLPKGVSKELYAAAMANLRRPSRFKAWKLMRKHGPIVAKTIAGEGGAYALKVFSKHGKSAVKSIKNHGIYALDSLRMNGPIAFKVLPKLSASEIARIKTALGLRNLFIGDYRTLQLMLREHGDEGFRQLLRDTQRFEKLFNAIAEQRRNTTYD